MSGPYFQQQGFGGSGGFYNAHCFDTAGGQNAGFSAGQSVGYFGGQPGGFVGSQGSNFVGGQQAGFTGGYDANQFFGSSSGQSVTYSTGSHSAADAGHIDRNHRTGSTSTSSSSQGGEKKAGGSSVGVSSTPAYPVGATSLDVSGGGFGSAVSTQRRPGRHRQQVFQLPVPAQGQVRQVRHRMPTPEPDTLERVYIQRTAPDIVEEITEIPTTPPPIVKEKTVVEPSGPPQVVKRVIRVPPRSGGFASQQQQQQQGGNFISAGNFGAVQQGAGNFQQFGGASTMGGFSGGGSFSAVGGGFQQPSQSFGGFGGFQSQAAPSSMGAPNAHCFYV